MKTVFIIFVAILIQHVDLLTREVILDEICGGVLFGSRAHPTREEVFVGCVEGKGVIFSCDDGKLFDPYLGFCTENLIPRDFNQKDCDGVTLGLFPLSKSDREFYFSCENSKSFLRKCPGSSIFDPKQKSCMNNFGSKKTTTTSTSKSTEEKTEELKTTSRYTLPTIPDIPSIPSFPTRPSTSRRTTTSRPLDTTTSSTRPNSTTKPPRTTSIRTRTSPRTTTYTQSSTTSSIQITTTSPILSTTTSPTLSSTSSSTRNPNDINVRFDCPLSGFGLIPSPVECNRYYECIRGIANPRYCPNGQIFDVITRECGSPETSLCADTIRCY
jgi:hypothetical protein